MTFEDVAAKAQEQKDKYVEQIADRVLFAATLSLKADFIERIFNKGLDSNDAKIGTYSTKPAYFSKEQFARQGAFVGQGKGGANPKAKSMYLKGGYDELRRIQGRSTPDKNESYTGSLSLNVAAGIITEGVYGVYLTSPKESAKRKGIEKQEGKPIFSISPSDRAGFEQAVNAEINIISQEQ